VPHDDLSLTTAQIIALDKLTIGNFTGPLFNCPTDLDVDSNVIYVADALNHRIAKVNLSTTPATITTFAGIPGSAGEVDGALLSAKFNTPTGLYLAQGGANPVIFVVDFGGTGAQTGYLRKIANGQVTTIPTSPALTSPLAVSALSTGTLVIAQASDQTVKLVEQTGGSLTQLGTAFGSGVTAPYIWIWLDVDTAGTVGSRDDILVAVSQDAAFNNVGFYRASADGTFRSKVAYDSYLPSGGLNIAYDAGGHYPWSIAISQTEARFITMGTGDMGCGVFRTYRVGIDPDYSDFLLGSADAGAYLNGKDIYERGTIVGGPTRPSFILLRGEQGYGRLGLPNFDDLAYYTDAALGAYIQAGMGGSVPRPEITGTSLGDLMYFIRVNSIRGNLERLVR
jgi:hypothetical protein